jgi:hypothetical protein
LKIFKPFSGIFGQIFAEIRHKKGYKSANIGPNSLGNTVFLGK